MIISPSSRRLANAGLLWGSFQRVKLKMGNTIMLRARP